ncbi:unnamed protein product [Paramecium sonneborni]|uniref:Protein kinase domain-containing protein n=1 Tax=Paramecium sonneborni TaxID=65129 RepID=A0A8S1KP31_9CILI|nr:unnamed protein product [Paramecium sonneborni]
METNQYNILMKKSGYQDDQSKISFFNDGNQLFTQIIDENFQFQDQGSFQMKYINKVSQIKIQFAENYLKIIDEVLEYENFCQLSSKYIQIENACLRVVMNLKNQQFGFRISKNGQQAEFYGKDLELIEKIKKYVIQSEFQKKYKIIAKIGSDYLSSVYKVQHQISGLKYAAKVVEKSRLTNGSKLEKDNFLNQINILRQLNHHNLLKLEEVYEGEQNIYIITELLEGGPIKQQLLNNSLTEQEKIKVMHSLFSNLYQLHKQNVYHQDIRYDNILLRDTQDLKTACLINYSKAIQIPSKKNTHILQDQESMLNLCMKRDIHSLSIILLSLFTKKLYRENQVLDELMMKNSLQLIQTDYMELSPQLYRFFEQIFKDMNKKQTDNLSCERILELDIFRVQQKPRNSKNFIAKQFLPLLPRRMSKYDPTQSDREKLDCSVNSIKFPPINRDSSTSAEKSLSKSPQSFCLLSNHHNNHNNIKNKSKLSQKTKMIK